MKPDENIIRYLSGEMSRKEADAFERTMAGNEELRESFDDHSLAWKLIGNQLKAKAEEDFRQKLEEVMKEKEEKGKASGNKWIWRFIPIAAAVALLLVILSREGGKEAMYVQYYQPSGDALLSAMLEETRGQADDLALLYQEEHYQSCTDKGLALWNKGGNEARILLLTLLSAMECEREAEILPILQEIDHDPAIPEGRALLWYHAMALLKAGDYTGALLLAERLAESNGAYQKTAHKLATRLKK